MGCVRQKSLNWPKKARETSKLAHSEQLLENFLSSDMQTTRYYSRFSARS